MDKQQLTTGRKEISRALTPTKEPEVPAQLKSQKFFDGDKEISSFSEEEESSDDNEVQVVKKQPVVKSRIPIKAGIKKPLDTKPTPAAGRVLRAASKITAEPATIRRTIIPAASTAKPPVRTTTRITKPAIPTQATPARRASTINPPVSRGETKMTVDKRVMLLRQQVEERSARVEKLESLLKEAKLESSKLEEEVTKVKAEKELILKEKAEAKLASEDELARVSIELQVKLEYKERQLKALEEKLMDSQCSVAALATEHQDQVDQLKQQLRVSAQEVARHKEKIQELLFSQGVAEARAMELTRLKADLKQAQEAHQNYITTTEQISGQLGRQLASYQQEICDLRNASSQKVMSRELDELKENMERKLKDEVARTSSYQSKVGTLERAILDLRSKLDSAPSPVQLKEALDLKAQLETKLVDEVQRSLENQDSLKRLQSSVHLLEEKLAQAPTQEQLTESAQAKANLEIQLQEQAQLTRQSQEKVTQLEANLAQVQQKLDHAPTLAQLQKSEATCASLEKQLQDALTFESKAAALETTIRDLQRKLNAAPTSNQIQEVETLKRTLEERLDEESQRTAEYQNKITDLEGSICDLEEKLISAPSKSQFQELCAMKDTLEASLAQESQKVKESQKEIKLLQDKLHPTTAQIKELEKEKTQLNLELTKTLAKMSSLETEVATLTKKLASAPTKEQFTKLQASDADKSRQIQLLESQQGKANALALEQGAELSRLEGKLSDFQHQMALSRKEITVARSVVKALREWEEEEVDTNKVISEMQHSHKLALELRDAREKELLLQIATLVSQIEDLNYKPSPQTKKGQLTLEAAIAHSEKLSRELSECKLANARKISALNHEKNQILKDLQVQQSLNFEIMREIEGHGLTHQHSANCRH